MNWRASHEGHGSQEPDRIVLRVALLPLGA